MCLSHDFSDEFAKRLTLTRLSIERRRQISYVFPHRPKENNERCSARVGQQQLLFISIYLGEVGMLSVLAIFILFLSSAGRWALRRSFLLLLYSSLTIWFLPFSRWSQKEEESRRRRNEPLPEGKNPCESEGKRCDSRKRGRTILDFSDRRLCARLSSLLFPIDSRFFRSSSKMNPTLERRQEKIKDQPLLSFMVGPIFFYLLSSQCWPGSSFPLLPVV